MMASTIQEVAVVNEGILKAYYLLKFPHLLVKNDMVFKYVEIINPFR